MIIKPIGDRVAVREIKVPDTSEGGIFVGEFVDDGFVKEISKGEVLAVGPGLPSKTDKQGSMWGLKPGDIVGYSPVCSYTQVIEDIEVTFIRRDAVVGVLA